MVYNTSATLKKMKEKINDDALKNEKKDNQVE